MTNLRSARWLAAAFLLLPTAGCDEAVPLVAQLSLDVRSCMIGTRRGVAGQEGGLCDRAITERFAGGLTACLALRVDGQDRVLPFVLQGKNLVPASDRTVSLPAGEPIQLKLFVLQPGASPEACAGYDVDTVCAGGDEPGPASCLFAMRQEQVQVSGGKGTTIVYGTADAPCGIECNDGCAPADAGCRRICGTMAAPLAEVCNGRDDDCDGQTDEGFVSEATSCGLGQCRASGVTSCAAGEVIDSCSPGEPRPEQCNGQDDDCDGLTDEELGGEPTSCGNGACAARGETVCSNGRLHDTCSPGAPPSERDATCDGVDDDCDRQADEDHAPRATSCGTGVCTAAGLTSCVQGREQDSCTPGMPEAAADTLCDGRDDDCDGQTDEDYRPIDTSCGRGACAARGLSFCQAGQEQDSCTANPPPAASDTSCNGRDDDCDGQTDEDHVPPATLCGKGVCARAGWLLCELGELRDTCVPGQPPAARDESCDGVDDDCNGVEDEDHVPGPSGCGVGDCAAVGISFCSGGQLRDTCVPGQPAATEVCDRRDNDCDGTTDESCGCVPGSYEPQRITCGTGACASVGWTACREGSIEERCTPGQPLARTDTTCDGVDDDCDGQADDDFTPSPTSCGVGACRAEGQLVCAEGRRGDSCLPLLAQREADATCDGVDDDCDGRSDEDYVSRDSTCGVGACRATGRTYCVQGGVVDSCRPGPPRAASDATCDGVDDDCDQAVDEDYAVVATSCGQGACAASGQRICEQGRTKSTCVAKSPLAARDESCDGVDDDCDSRTDEEHSGQQITCGDGPCAATGITACLLGREESFCLPRPPLAETDESCDGVDDDCDGSPDDEYLAIAVSCGIGACRDEGLTACRDGAVIGSCIPREAALDDTTCDGVDDDCDGLVDESCPCAEESYVPVTTHCGVGACSAQGATFCRDGRVADSCTPGVPLAAADETCDGIDEDCDGWVDEDISAVDTSCGLGSCAATGRLICSGGRLRDSCRPVPPSFALDERCDGVDEDCDGETDEDFPDSEESCGTGACLMSGALVCSAGEVVLDCTPGEPRAAQDTTCDGVDDDCDDALDEDFPPQPTSCGKGVCTAAGLSSCQGGQLRSNCTPGAPLAPTDTLCNGLDDDCDGQTDEEYVRTSTSCGTGACRRTGLSSCVGGIVQSSCTPGVPAVDDAVCDGLDSDCDGATDEGYGRMETGCGVGACRATGLSSCVGGVVQSNCTPGAPAASDATCDGVDEDCSGQADEDFVPLATSCGLGACRRSGQRTCFGGALVDGCTLGSPAPDDAGCDGVDQDCDGRVDEDFPPAPVECGVGRCTAMGETICRSGHVVEDCTAGQPAADDSLCNGLDDDCDGAADEDCECNPVTYQPRPTTCGVGACRRTGISSCPEGRVLENCTPGQPAASDATCNGVDDDCNGTADEDFVPQATSCGVGACAAVGLATCHNGELQSSCTPGHPAASDATCNGVDDDCSGTADEDYVPQATSCGVGACRAAGLTSCVNGQQRDSCVPGPAAASDTSCDGVDDDCSGTADEGYLPHDTSCGLGVCASTGRATCSGGVETDSCQPGQGAADDTCNGVDDDCDGTADEDYDGQATACGTGECAATGESICVAGQLQDGCQPGDPVDERCDGQDNDCNGTSDDGFSLGTGCLTSNSPCGAGVLECACNASFACPDADDLRWDETVCSREHGGTAFGGSLLACRDSISANTSSSGDRTDTTRIYTSAGCGTVTGRDGNELRWAFISDRAYTVRVRISANANGTGNMGKKLDVFVLQEQCLGSACIARGATLNDDHPETVTFNARAGVLYYLVVDGDGNADNGAFRLNVACCGDGRCGVGESQQSCDDDCE